MKRKDLLGYACACTLAGDKAVISMVMLTEISKLNQRVLPAIWLLTI